MENVVFSGSPGAQAYFLLIKREGFDDEILSSKGDETNCTRFVDRLTYRNCVVTIDLMRK